jgi:hypothetical protein
LAAPELAPPLPPQPAKEMSANVKQRPPTTFALIEEKLLIDFLSD